MRRPPSSSDWQVRPWSIRERHAILAALIFFIAAPGRSAEAHASLSATQLSILRQPAQPAPDTSFDFGRPPGPAFTAAEKESQRERGRTVWPTVRAAYEQGKAQVRIPAGHYRFANVPRNRDGPGFPLEFASLRRDADAPFVIDATGATFWFDLGDEQMPPGHGCIRFLECSNVVFKGATIDRGTRGVIEGKITGFDRAGNRIELAVSPGCLVPERFKNGQEQRLLPFKADGRFCAPLYDLQSGGVRLKYRDIAPSATSGRYWLTMESPALLETIHDPNWIAAYGDLGVLRVGDGLSCVYSTCQALVIARSRNVTVLGVSVHVAKGGGVESGGWGGHLWKDCYFGPRPGTNQWQGGDGFMFNATRHGTTLDHVAIRHSSDDMANFHGYWGNIRAIAGNRITFEAERHFTQLVLPEVAPGDRVRFYDKATARLLGEARVQAVESSTVTLDTPADRFASAMAEWPDQSCAGWTVQHCDWSDNYQRLLIASGPGVVRNNVFARTGHAITLNSVLTYVEGGVPQDIVIEGNRFIDVNCRPNGAAISSHTTAFQRPHIPRLTNIVIRYNVFVRPGGAAISLRGADGVVIAGNVFEEPLGYTVRARPADRWPQQAVQLMQCSEVRLERNVLHDPSVLTAPHATTRSHILGVDEQCRGVMLDGRALTAFPE